MGSPLADEVTDDLRGRIVVGNVAGLVGNAHPEPFGADLASEEVFHQRMPGWLDEEAIVGDPDVVDAYGFTRVAAKLRASRAGQEG